MKDVPWVLKVFEAGTDFKVELSFFLMADNVMSLE